MSKLLVISGPSGVGKGTIVNHLKEMYETKNKKLYLSISCTTRSPREGEVDGREYFFISEKEFKSRIKKCDFLEYNKYCTVKYYGTTKSTVLKYLDYGYDVILEIDINGYNILDTMKYSNIAGALSVTKIGSKNSMPELEDVINYHE